MRPWLPGSLCMRLQGRGEDKEEILCRKVFIWLAILTFFLVAEAVTVQLTTIWFAGGALVAALAAGMGAEEWLQIILFLAVSDTSILGQTCTKEMSE